jgi:hypothetical protein
LYIHSFPGFILFTGRIKPFGYECSIHQKQEQDNGFPPLINGEKAEDIYNQFLITSGRLPGTGM